MSWRVVATVLIVVFTATLLWTVTADPLRQTGDAFIDSNDDGGQINVDGKIDSAIRGYSNVFLILIFGVMGWGMWRVLRRELTRGGQL